MKHLEETQGQNSKMIVEVQEYEEVRHYMAPEAFQRDSVYDCKIDVWSLGISTYVMLTSGSYPFDAPFLSQIEDQIATAPVSFPSDCRLSQEAKDFVAFLLVNSFPGKSFLAPTFFLSPFTITRSII